MATKKTTDDEDVVQERSVPSDENSLVKVKIHVNVWDHNGNKIPKGQNAVLKLKQALALLEEKKASRIDPIPVEGK